MNQFREPIYKDDLMPVIRQGIFMAFIAGILMGAVQLLFSVLFSLEFSFLLFIVIAFLISRRVKQTYSRYHILYQIIAVFAFVLAYYLMRVTNLIGVFYIQNLNNIIVEYWRVILDPNRVFYFLNPFSNIFFELEVILQLIFFMIGVFYTFIRSK